MIDAIIVTCIFLFTHAGRVAIGAAYARKRYDRG